MSYCHKTIVSSNYEHIWVSIYFNLDLQYFRHKIRYFVLNYIFLWYTDQKFYFKALAV